jgi:hypothetical protein
MIFVTLKDEVYYYNHFYHLPYQPLVGIFNVKEFHIVNPLNTTYNTDSLKWKKLAISQGNGIQVQLMNDSLTDYDYQVDVLNRIITLKAWWPDTTTKAKLHYLESGSSEWLFEGIYKTDSIRFSSTKIEMYSLPLLKGRGKIKWVYD